jgi:hypothetical protein
MGAPLSEAPRNQNLFAGEPSGGIGSLGLMETTSHRAA